MKILAMCCLLCLSINESFCGEFINLDFQSPHYSAVVAALPSGPIAVADAIPGWTVYTSDHPVAEMLYNGVCLTCPAATLGGPERPPRPGDSFNFEISSGVIPTDPTFTPVSESVAQVGDIPKDTKSLHFIALVAPDAAYLHTYLDGNEIQTVVLGREGLQEVTIGADLSGWGGRHAELRFTIEPNPIAIAGRSSVDLGEIHFSPDPLTVVPEPESWVLLAVGLGALFCSRLPSKA
jgi:hypothetical protein